MKVQLADVQRPRFAIHEFYQLVDIIADFFRIRPIAGHIPDHFQHAAPVAIEKVLDILFGEQFFRVVAAGRVWCSRAGPRRIENTLGRRHLRRHGILFTGRYSGRHAESSGKQNHY